MNRLWQHGCRNAALSPSPLVSLELLKRRRSGAESSLSNQSLAQSLAHHMIIRKGWTDGWMERWMDGG
jgi:hypothetical protein